MIKKALTEIFQFCRALILDITPITLTLICRPQSLHQIFNYIFEFTKGAYSTLNVSINGCQVTWFDTRIELKMIKNQTKLSNVSVLLFIKYFCVIVQLTRLSNLFYSENIARFTFLNIEKIKFEKKEIGGYQQLKSVQKYVCENDKNININFECD